MLLANQFSMLWFLVVLLCDESLPKAMVGVQWWLPP
jgi:hypothetical protein